ncbi:YhdP family protein [Massilia sp. TS11]|uniref:YhdP family protein n=1 Tax=Massilia sp. TS11 TaxID=2908003 RepID=UPI001EDAF439|nr:YhdP family protein [Massilia sp. TS11]MCG2585897.1 TIGR02099 family protein [Massilia sp. TS11]
MSDALHNPEHGHHPHLAERWRRLRAAYRLANRVSHHALGFAVKTVALVYFLFALAFLALRYAVLPNIDLYKADIERMAGRALGNPVSIARIYASWNGLRPNFFLGDVRLHDAAGRQLLHLPSVSATVSWWSVLALDVRFQQLELIGPDLDILRRPDGRIQVAGIVLDTAQGQGQGADWALQQHEVVIRDGRVHWTDQKRGAPELVLEKLNLVLRNRWTHHQFALQATPPAALGQPVDVRADFSHPRFATRIADVARWKGELYADVRGSDLAAWKAYVDYPFAVQSGRGAVRAWISLDQARLAGITADVQLADVQARLAPELPALDLVQVAGRLSAKETIKLGVAEGLPTFGAHGHSIGLENFSVLTRDGLSLPPTTLNETYYEADGKKPARVELTAKLVDLATFAELAAQLPLSPSQRQLLADLEPRGQLRNVSAQWEGHYPAISSYKLKAELADLALKAQPARAPQPKTATSPALPGAPAIPGFAGLSGSIDASEKGGSLQLDSRNLMLHLPGYMIEPDLQFDTATMKSRWSYEAKNQFLFQADQLVLTRGPMKLQLQGRHLLPLDPQAPNPLGTVDIDGSISRFEINQVGAWLPSATGADLQAWLTRALEAGVLKDATLKLRGELAHFPFAAPADKPHGEFRVAGKLENARLNYVPGEFAKDGKAPLWPVADKINGSIVFDRARMEIKGDTARTLGVSLNKVTAVVADLLAHDLMLDIDGSASGPLQEFMKYVAASPVADFTGHVLDETRAGGNTKLALKLHIPLNHAIDTRVQGALQLAGNDIVLFNDLPPALGTSGKIEFNERGVNLNTLNASMLGGPLTVSGGSQKDGAILVRFGGQMTAEGLKKTYPGAGLQRVLGHISGNTRFSGSVLVKDHATTVNVESSLAGLGLDFPAPLRKAAPDSLPLRFVLSSTDPARDDIRISLGNSIGARYQRQKQGKQWSVLRAGVGVNATVPEPDSGLQLNVNLKTLNVDQWSALGNSVASARPDARAAAEGGLDFTPYIAPDIMAAHATEMIVADRKIDNVVIGMTRQRGVWQANVDARQASGHITYAEGPGAGKITARLASLLIPDASEAAVKDIVESSKTASMPALDIVAERFELSNKQLGRLELVANNVPREWRINKLALVTPDGKLDGTGKWVLGEGKSSTTSLNFNLDIGDAGKLLERLGFPDTLKRGKGKLSGDLAWNGLPHALDLPSLSGNVVLNVENGQFLKQDPGAAKLLGVLSLQALPRLLKLDFNDVFSEGLAFDGIAGTAAIARGTLRTDNLKMHGVQATVLMDGAIDIANETTNLHVVVIPEFNLGTGSLMYLAVNPVVGVTSMLAQLFLRQPVMKALTYQMQVAGPWKAPVVTKLDSGKLAPVPDKGPPKAAAPSSAKGD